eukprot:3485640-Rhodomonas_salina.2
MCWGTRYKCHSERMWKQIGGGVLQLPYDSIAVGGTDALVLLQRSVPERAAGGTRVGDQGRLHPGLLPPYSRSIPAYA